MSDGMTDVRRDEDRRANYTRYIVALASYLTNPNEENKTEAIKIAKETDDVKRGYWDAPTIISPNLASHLHDLKNALEEQRMKEGKLSFEMRTGRKR